MKKETLKFVGLGVATVVNAIGVTVIACRLNSMQQTTNLNLEILNDTTDSLSNRLDIIGDDVNGMNESFDFRINALSARINEVSGE